MLPLLLLAAAAAALLKSFFAFEEEACASGEEVAGEKEGARPSGPRGLVSDGCLTGVPARE